MRGFRAWHKKLNRYLEPHEFYITPIGEIATACFTTLDGEVITVNSIEDFSCNDFEEGLVILEEDTGLKDKNGKEIYEGDIVTLNGEWEEIDHGDCSIVTFENGCFRVGDGYENEAGSYLSDWRIIGNIYKNSELLGGTNVTNKEGE